MAPDEQIREDELEIVPLLQLGHSSGILDQLWSTRFGRGYQEGMRLIAQVEKELWQARFIAPLLAAGADQQTAMELAAQRAVDLNAASLLDRALLAAYRRRQELAWTEQLVETIEAALDETGGLAARAGPGDVLPGLVGYTRLTEEHGDQAAAALAGRLAVLSALQLVAQLPEAGLPPAHVGVRPGRWWSRAATTSAAPSTWPPGSPPMPAPVGSW
jgi:adenylate cyclase